MLPSSGNRMKQRVEYNIEVRGILRGFREEIIWSVEELARAPLEAGKTKLDWTRNLKHLIFRTKQQRNFISRQKDEGTPGPIAGAEMTSWHEFSGNLNS